MTAGLVGGRYVLGERVGAGGSADVFAATDVRMARRVAVRLERDPAPAGADPWQDVRAAASLEHPHVVRVLDAGLDRAGRRYVVLDLVDGVTLAALLRERGPLAPADALTVVAAVLDGLSCAHEHGVLHLDLSPSNVMVPRAADGSGRLDLAAALLLDVAGAGERAVPGRTVTVSPHYASPEVATAAPADARADLYSVGAVLHELVTGRPPYVAADPQAVLRAQVHAPVPVPSALAPGVPAQVDRIVGRALCKERTARYGDARAMRAEVVAAAARLRAVPAVPAPAPGALPGTWLPGTPPGGTRLLVPVRSATPAAVPDPVSGGGLGAGAWVAALAVVVGVAVAVGLGGAAGAGVPGDAAPVPPAVAAEVLSAGPADAPSEPPAGERPAEEGSAGERSAEPPGGPSEVSVVPVPVPDVLGADLADVETVLGSAGLVLGAVTRVDGAQRKDVVLTVDPPPGSVVAPGTGVALRVASGMAPVPAVAGSAAGTAAATLVDAGLRVEQRTAADAPAGTRAGSVVRTSPAAGRRLPVGALVVLEVAAADVPQPVPAPSPRTPGTPDEPVPAGSRSPGPAPDERPAGGR